MATQAYILPYLGLEPEWVPIEPAPHIRALQGKYEVDVHGSPPFDARRVDSLRVQVKYPERPR